MKVYKISNSRKIFNFEETKHLPASYGLDPELNSGPMYIAYFAKVFRTHGFEKFDTSAFKLGETNLWFRGRVDLKRFESIIRILVLDLGTRKIQRFTNSMHKISDSWHTETPL